MAAAINNGGSVNNVQPGINFFQTMHTDGNFNPIEAGGAGDGPMADKSVLATIDWNYNQLSWKQELAKSPGIDWKIVVPKGKPYAAYYAMAISAYAPHPAAARLWLEYLYSPTGQNLWAEGGALPVTWTTMVKDGTASAAAKAGVPALTQTPVIATPGRGDEGPEPRHQGVGVCSRLIRLPLPHLATAGPAYQTRALPSAGPGDAASSR